MYFFFNESEEPQKVNALLEGSGQVQEWDAMTGEIRDMEVVSKEKEQTKLELNMEKYGTKFICIKQQVF